METERNETKEKGREGKEGNGSGTRTTGLDDYGTSIPSIHHHK